MAESPDDDHSARNAFLVAVAAFVLYLPALLNGFVNWDDDLFVLTNAAVRSPDGLARIWSTLELPEDFPNYPLVFTSFWIDHRLWGLDPVGFHAVNHLLHGANAGLVLLLARAIGAPSFAALLAALLFAFHPMQVESVAWVSERKNLLSTFFYLCAFLAFVRHRASGETKWYGLSLSMFAAALLSKTAVLTLPLSLLVLERLRSGRWDRAVAWRVAPMFALGALAALATASIEPRTIAHPWLTRPLVASAALLFYAGKLVVPAPLLPIYPRWEVDAGWFWLLPPIGVLAAAFVVARGRQWRWRWGMAHFACSLLPVIGLMPFGFLEYSFVADHHVYLASIGFLLAPAEALDRWRRRNASRLAQLAAILLLSSLCGLTLRQIPIWYDSESLWRHVTDGNPAAYAAFSNLGLALAEKGNLVEARTALERAIAVRPDYAQAFNNLAMVEFREGDFAASERIVTKAVQLMPQVADYRKNLALALRAQGKPDEAAAALREAVRLTPRNASFHQLLGNMLVDGADLPGAVAVYREALRLAPELVDARSQLGRVLLALHEIEPAIAAFEAVVAATPRRPEAHYNLAIALLDDGRALEATQHLEEALRLQPGFQPAREALRRLSGASSDR